MSKGLGLARMNSMQRIIVLAILLGIAASNAQARLGETEKQSEDRYGLPTAQAPSAGADKTFRYDKDGIKVIGDFVKGKCLCITYSIPDDKLSQQRIDLVFQAEGGRAWATFPGGKATKIITEYVRSDRQAVAVKEHIYWLPSTIFTFQLNEWTKLHDQAVNDQEAAKKAAEQAAEHERMKKLGKEL